jgi:exosome complex protein LRP1
MSTEEIPKKAVRALRTRIQVVKDHLEPLMARPLNETYSKLSMTEKYELQVLLSYTLNTLYYSNDLHVMSSVVANGEL